ncbi:hypothetical protein VCLMA_B0573 [Vibrio cholerae LMA3984-4]|nr:hypothetical protein VCLMA_B0573 [Vibrio cholerae LMA3984-4]
MEVRSLSKPHRPLLFIAQSHAQVLTELDKSMIDDNLCMYFL